MDSANAIARPVVGLPAHPSRRQFLAVTASLVGTAWLGPRLASSASPIDLDAFCGSQTSRPGLDLSRLYTWGNHVYATDGRIAIRVPTADPTDEQPRFRRAMDALPWSAHVAYQPWPRRHLVIPPWRHKCQHPDLCPMCDAEPDCECTYCGSSGFVANKPSVQFVANEYVNGWLDGLVRHLHAVEVGIVSKAAQRVPHGTFNLLKIRFLGGEGVLAGVEAP